MQIKHLCILIQIRIKGEVGTVYMLNSSSILFYWPFQGSASFVDLFLLFITGKVLTYWLSCVMFSCDMSLSIWCCRSSVVLDRTDSLPSSLISLQKWTEHLITLIMEKNKLALTTMTTGIPHSNRSSPINNEAGF